MGAEIALKRTPRLATAGIADTGAFLGRGAAWAADAGRLNGTFGAAYRGGIRA